MNISFFRLRVNQPRARQKECIHVFSFVLGASCAVVTAEPLRYVSNVCLPACLPNEVIWELIPNEHRDYRSEPNWTSHKFFFVCMCCSCAISTGLTCCVDAKYLIFDEFLCCGCIRMLQQRLPIPTERLTTSVNSVHACDCKRHNSNRKFSVPTEFTKLMEKHVHQHPYALKYIHTLKSYIMYKHIFRLF